MATVLVIDDDTALLAACRVGLRALGHQVRTAATGDAGLSDAAVHPPDVVVLDLGLPDMDGMQVFNQLREWTQTPVIILSADGSKDRKVEARNGGTDDYVTKPFGMRELDARLRVALRHSATDHAEQITQLDAGPLTLSLLHYEASYRGERIDLTPKEFDFLAYLARHVGKVCTRRRSSRVSGDRGTSTNTTTSRSTHTASARNSMTNKANFCRTIPRWDTG